MKKKNGHAFLTVIAVIVALMMVPAAAFAKSEKKFKATIFTLSEKEIRATMQSLNEQLKAMRQNVRIEVVDYLTAWDEVGQTVYFDERTKQLGEHFVPGDPRRGGYSDIYWLSDQVDGAAAGVALADTQAAVDRAMATWDGVNCSTIPLIKLDDFGIDWGVVQYLEGFGGVPFWYADITHAGWLPGDFFDAVFGTGASDVVLGATATYVWVDSEDNPTDIDNNGKIDVAFRETYYNNKFSWGINTDFPIDVETAVLHETGHGLSQGHFGKLFRTDANGMFHFAPRAVMNSGYTGVQQDLTGTDNGGHCSIWGSWPNN